MKRRTFLANAAALAVPALPRPAIAQAAATTLKFIPEGNLQNPDPIWSTTTVARNFGYMIWDTLYGWDGILAPKPQMCEGHETSDNGLTWRFRLRDGLMFHDGTTVRAADCVASIQRWMKRDGFAQRIETSTNELVAEDDRTFVFRLKKPFPLLANGLGKPTANVCFITPERIAKTDPFKQIRRVRPGSALVNSAGLETLTGPRDLARAKKLVAESGFSGEKIVFIAPTD